MKELSDERNEQIWKAALRTTIEVPEEEWRTLKYKYARLRKAAEALVAGPFNDRGLEIGTEVGIGREKIDALRAALGEEGE